jgi:ABC-type branched-subunit amino acid transport system ATPase component
MLEAANVSKSFGALKVLLDVSITVSPGTVHGLIGPNGAGKTTLVNVLTGHIQPDQGGVLLDGASISRLPPHRRAQLGISRSFQAPRLLEDLTVIENVRLGQHMLSRLDDARLHEVARLLDLEAELERPVGKLPTGQRRLVELARSLVGRPKVLLLDEPFAGLTGAEIRTVGRIIRRLSQDLGLAVLLIEHNLSEVFSLSERVSVLDRGHLVAAGTAAEVADSSEVRTIFFGGEKAADFSKSAKVDVSSDEIALSAQGLSAGYGRLQVIHDVNVQVRRREIVGLVGVNGAGKSTLLRALSGHARVMAGTVELHGAPAKLGNAPALVRSGLALVPEGRHLFTSLSAEDNLHLAGVAAGLGRAEIRQRLELIYTALPQIHALRARPAGALSGGQQQAVTIARALMCKPSVLLLDEPSIGLSRPALEALAPQLMRLVEQEDISLLLAEQNVGFASLLCDRSYLMDAGTIISEGRADIITAAWEEQNERRAHALEEQDQSCPEPKLSPVNQ